MYYKITDKESELYKKLHTLRTKELQLEESNKKLIKEIVGDDWNWFVGRMGQQNINRCTQYSGFQFRHPENLPPKAWVLDKEYGDKGVYVPNRRSKAGKEISEKLSRMPHSSMFDVFEILECEIGGRFTIPYVEICKSGEIIVYMDDKYDLEKNFNEVIEITKREAEELINQK